MDFSKYPHLTTSQIVKGIRMVDRGEVVSVQQPKTNNPVVVELNQLIRDYIEFKNSNETIYW